MTRCPRDKIFHFSNKKRTSSSQKLAHGTVVLRSCWHSMALAPRLRSLELFSPVKNYRKETQVCSILKRFLEQAVTVKK